MSDVTFVPRVSQRILEVVLQMKEIVSKMSLQSALLPLGVISNVVSQHSATPLIVSITAQDEIFG